MNKAARQTAEARGRRAETYAALLLRAKGYRILQTRYKIRAGEIDIIAKRGKLLVMVEVKQRANLRAAHDSLHIAALRRIENAADHYQAANPFAHNLAVRFDAVFVLPRFKILHIKDAWRAG